MSDPAGLAAQTRAYTTARSDVADLVPASAMLLLDVGCSNGALGAYLKTARPGRRVWGIEIDVAFSNQAAAKLDRVWNCDLGNFNWQAEMPGNPIDCIVFSDVLEHVADPAKHLAQALTSLAPGGSVVVSLPNIRHLSALLCIFGLGTFPRRPRGIFDATHLRWFTVSDGRRLLTDLGLIIDGESYSLRMGDKGGGRINRLLNRLPLRLKRSFLLREFFAYQYCLRARCVSAANDSGAMQS